MAATLPRYAVFGNPVAHSKSPQIHRQFALQEKVQIEYGRILAEPGGFAAAAGRFFAEGGLGANVTVPFKTDAYDWVDEHSERAKAACAVNTIIPLGSGRFLGDNTDGAGLAADITEAQATALQNRRILILGAGGAVRGVVPVLLQQQPADITIANRTEAKARELAERFGIRAAPLNGLPANRFDIIINATSGSLSGEIPAVAPEVFGSCVLAYDMVYGAAAQAFLDYARRSGAQKTADGLGMLVGQAAFSYRLWRGFSPDIQAVIRYMRKAV
ncbi:shikimate dehydrogenase [Neisseria musculi]|uniref:Shikimate dehydrogenase (NADP(+)) n=1 Tax=Neisseria musculi TaxID=1815583 RepID=A0A7H1MB30_9NEIS|nr:shikimate dehydrogenase [Neisseria musculi]QNT58845.1 shikimate 5-dehydrogenase [Neisseria musculi]